MADASTLLPSPEVIASSSPALKAVYAEVAAALTPEPVADAPVPPAPAAPTTPTPSAPEAKPAAPAAKPDEKPAADPAAAPATPAPLDVAAIRKAVNEGGNFDDNATKALTALGIDADTLGELGQAFAALQEIRTNAVYKEAGGAEKYAEVTTWASQNFTAAEKAAFNAGVQSRDPATVKLTVAGALRRFEAENGTAGSGKVFGTTPASGTGEQYTSRQDYFKDLRDPRWGTDQVFSDGVVRKLQNTPNL